MPYEVRLEAFESLREEWLKLLPSSPVNCIFLNPHWIELWWRAFGATASPCLLSLRKEGRVLGIAPLMYRGDSLVLIGEEDVSDYRDFIVSQEAEEEVYEALWAHLEHLDWKRLELMGLPDSSPTRRVLIPLVRQNGCAVEERVGEVCPRMSLPQDWESYLESLSKKDRHELRRKLRRLMASEKVAYYAVSGTEKLEEAIEDFLSLLSMSREDKAAFMTPERKGFFTRMTPELVRLGLLRLFFLEVNDVRVASCACFDYNGAYSLYNSGYDPHYSQLSVGLLLKALCIKEAIEQGKTTFDFLRGAEGYKYDLGGKDSPIYNVVISR